MQHFEEERAGPLRCSTPKFENLEMNLSWDISPMNSSFYKSQHSLETSSDDESCSSNYSRDYLNSWDTLESTRTKSSQPTNSEADTCAKCSTGNHSHTSREKDLMLVSSPTCYPLTPAVSKSPYFLNMRVGTPPVFSRSSHSSSEGLCQTVEGRGSFSGGMDQKLDRAISPIIFHTKATGVHQPTQPSSVYEEASNSPNLSQDMVDKADSHKKLVDSPIISRTETKKYTPTVGVFSQQSSLTNDISEDMNVSKSMKLASPCVPTSSINFVNVPQDQLEVQETLKEDKKTTFNMDIKNQQSSTIVELHQNQNVVKQQAPKNLVLSTIKVMPANKKLTYLKQFIPIHENSSEDGTYNSSGSSINNEIIPPKSQGTMQGKRVSVFSTCDSNVKNEKSGGQEVMAVLQGFNYLEIGNNHLLNNNNNSSILHQATEDMLSAPKKEKSLHYPITCEPGVCKPKTVNEKILNFDRWNPPKIKDAIVMKTKKANFKPDADDVMISSDQVVESDLMNINWSDANKDEKVLQNERASYTAQNKSYTPTKKKSKSISSQNNSIHLKNCKVQLKRLTNKTLHLYGISSENENYFQTLNVNKLHVAEKSSSVSTLDVSKNSKDGKKIKKHFSDKETCPFKSYDTLVNENIQNGQKTNLKNVPYCRNNVKLSRKRFQQHNSSVSDDESINMVRKKIKHFHSLRSLHFPSKFKKIRYKKLQAQPQLGTDNNHQKTQLDTNSNAKSTGEKTKPHKSDEIPKLLNPEKLQLKLEHCCLESCTKRRKFVCNVYSNLSDAEPDLLTGGV